MGNFRNDRNVFLQHEALKFFRNFIQNHQDAIEDNDVFAILDDLAPSGEWIRIIKKSFDERKLNALQTEPCHRDRLNFDDEPKEILREIWCNVPARKTLRTLILHLIDEELAQRKPDCKHELFPKRLNELQMTLGLSDFEKDILLVLALVNDGRLCIADGHDRRTGEADKILFLAKCLDCRREDVLKAIVPQQRLRRYHCIDDDLDFNRNLQSFLIGIENEPLANSYFQKFKGETLPWEFYGNLAQKHGAVLKEMIGAERGSSPVNILLYGAPGTGKTSFARTLAADLRLDCYFIAQNTNGNRSGHSCSTPEFRFGALQICDAQVDPLKSILIVDEADDMLSSSCSEGGLFTLIGGTKNGVTGNKGMLNSVLDTVKSPAIWITNTPSEMLDESSRRRFDYSIRFEPLSGLQRLAIWRNNIAKMKLGKMFDEPMLETFASQYAVSAGGITLVLQNIVKLKPKKADIPTLVDQLMTQHCELLDIKNTDEKLLPAKDYSLQGLNLKNDIQLPRLVEAIRKFQADNGSASSDRPRMNLLLSGPPGTGKTEFVKYLGAVLKTKVVVQMGSSLLSMFVGGTEQNIKQAFAMAEAEKAILFLDEIDGLLQSRERSQRSWEVTQVNELLYQMENFNGILIGATNFAVNLDPATARRFTFKVEFDYLTDSGKQIFFEQMFQRTLSPGEAVRLAAISTLTPGDFRTVRQSLYYLGGESDNHNYLTALEHESRMKQKNQFSMTKVGF